MWTDMVVRGPLRHANFRIVDRDGVPGVTCAYKFSYYGPRRWSGGQLGIQIFAMWTGGQWGIQFFVLWTEMVARGSLGHTITINYFEAAHKSVNFPET